VNNSPKNDFPVPPWVPNNPDANSVHRDSRQRPDLLVIAFALIAAIVIGGVGYVLYMLLQSM
jgi:hypothetical protein